MFEWDESKNRQNLVKPGIAFEDVLSVFANREALALETSAGTMANPGTSFFALSRTCSSMCPTRCAAGTSG
jgi:uncharacterized DUF497 family protein